MNYFDPDLLTFITAYCSKCTNEKCAGALFDSSRDMCSEFKNWTRLNPAEKSKLFLAAAIDEIKLMEEIVS